MSRALLLMLASVGAFALPLQAADTRESSVGKYSGYSPPLYSERVQSNFFVQARDGVRLAVTLYRPAVNGAAVETPYPVLFSFTPYRRVYKTRENELRGEAESEYRGGKAFGDLTKYGYVVAVADVRGKGASFGVRGAYQDDNEARDGYDLVEWLARQPWSAGKVGMFGCSYVGGTQVATARLAPPSLKAIFVQAGPFDSYRMASKGGISGQFNTRYQSNEEDLGTLPVDEDPHGILAELARAQHSRNGQMLDFITKMPYRDDHDPATDVEYWRMVSPYEHLDTIEKSGIAAYFWGNWFDEVADQSLISFATLRHNPRKLLMGTGTHCDVGEIDAFAEHLRFFDHYLKHVDNGIEREPLVSYATVNGPAGQALATAPTWPPPGVTMQHWYLNNASSHALQKTAFDGSLSIKAGGRSQIAYQVNYDVGCIIDKKFVPGVGVLKPGEEKKPQPGYWPCVLDDIGATFTAVPLTHDLTLIGTPSINLVLQTKASELNVFAYLETVTPDQKVTIISHGRLKATARMISPAPYNNLGNAWHSNRRSDAQPLDAREPFAMNIELSPTAILIGAGTRLRLTITGADLRQRNLDSIKVMPPPSMSIFAGEGGSTVSLPIADKPHS